MAKKPASQADKKAPAKKVAAKKVAAKTVAAKKVAAKKVAAKKPGTAAARTGPGPAPVRYLGVAPSLAAQKAGGTPSVALFIDMTAYTPAQIAALDAFLIANGMSLLAVGAGGGAP